jgi:DNA helicase INO80
MKDEVRETPPALSHNMLNEMQAPPPARADPMSLSSIMSAGTDNDPPPKAQPPPILSPDHQMLSKPSPNPLFVKQEPMPSPAPEAALQDNGIQPVGILHPSQHSAQPRELPVPDEAEIEAALAHIETKQMNDLDTSVAPFEHDEWKQRSLKRGLEVISGETTKRKVCVQV